MKTLRSKFIIYISLLVFGVISGSGLLLIKGEIVNVQTQIFYNVRSYTELTSQKIIDSYKDFYLQENEIFFERDLQELLSMNANVDGFTLYNYVGEKLYQTENMSDKSKNQDISLDRIKSQKPSIQVVRGDKTFYVDKIGVGEYQFLNTDFEISNFTPDGKQIENYIVPLNQEFSLVFHTDYSNLNQLVITALKASGYILVLALLAGILVSYFLASKISSPILKITDSVKKIALGYFETRVKVKTNDEL